MSYIKITTSFCNSENINFSDEPTVTLVSTYNSYEYDSASRRVDSRTILAPLSGDTATALLDGQRCRTVAVEAVDGPLIIDYDSLPFCIVQTGQTMVFTALPTLVDQDLYGVRSNNASEQYQARIITTSYDEL